MRMLVLSKLWSIMAIHPVMPRVTMTIRLPSMSFIKVVSFRNSACPIMLDEMSMKRMEVGTPKIGERTVLRFRNSTTTVPYRIGVTAEVFCVIKRIRSVNSGLFPKIHRLCVCVIKLSSLLSSDILSCNPFLWAL